MLNLTPMFVIENIVTAIELMGSPQKSVQQFAFELYDEVSEDNFFAENKSVILNIFTTLVTKLPSKVI